jgi:hypothetical protein
MDINIDIDLTGEEERQLSGILRCDQDELNNNLEPFIAAAAEEYVRLFLGQKVFTRGSDFREYRLFLLIHYAFDNEIPDEQQICDLFQTTVNQARSLIRSVMSKYQYELAEAIKKSLCNVVLNARYSEENEVYLITVDNENIIDALNRMIGAIDGTLPPVTKRRSTVSTYKFPASSYERVANELGIRIEMKEK